MKKVLVIVMLISALGLIGCLLPYNDRGHGSEHRDHHDDHRDHHDDHRDHHR